MSPLSPWAITAAQALTTITSDFIYHKSIGTCTYKIHCTNESLYLLAQWPKGGNVLFRLAYSPAGDLKIDTKKEPDSGVQFKLTSSIGSLKVDINLSQQGLFKFTTTLKPSADLFIPFWPRDIIIPGNGKPENVNGKIQISQVGTRSGLIYFNITKPKAGSVLYLQNLTSLARYNEDTQTSAGDTVGGQWPEMGFALPPATDKPLKAGRAYIISDAIVVINSVSPIKKADVTEQYLNMLAEAYLQLPKPETKYQNWPDILERGLHDLTENAGCWSQVQGNQYFNAYIADYATPPEIMVQLAVLLPLTDYCTWSGKKLPVIQKIKGGLLPFFDKKYGTIMRWHPAAADTLEGEEEQKEPLVMDSWYLHHPLLNLSRLALKGDKIASKLFLDSIDFAIKVAHHFNYEWPVFYKIDNLEIIKAETQPGKGGEKDVPGLYAHVMLQAYELTGKKRFLNEAEKAAKS